MSVSRALFSVGSLLMAIGLLAGCSAKRVSRPELLGSYSRTHAVQVNGENGWVSRDARDTLRLDPAGNARVRFQLRVWHRNLHSCYMQGVARDTGNDLEYREMLPAQYGEGAECVLRISTSSSDIVLEDFGDNCRRAYCGGTGSIDGVRFPLTREA